MPKAPIENGLTKILQLGCAALVLAMALNAPSPNGQGGWRDQFIDGYRQAQADDQPPTNPAPANADVAQGTGQ